MDKDFMNEDAVRTLRADARAESAATAMAMALQATEHEGVVYDRVVIEDDRGGTGNWVVDFQRTEPDAVSYYKTTRRVHVAQGTFEGDCIQLQETDDDKSK